MRLQFECWVKTFCKLQARSHNHKQQVRPTPKTHGERSIQSFVQKVWIWSDIRLELVVTSLRRMLEHPTIPIISVHALYRHLTCKKPLI